MKNNSKTFKILFIELGLVLFKENKLLNSWRYSEVANLDEHILDLSM